jgi:hypothetical protein
MPGGMGPGLSKRQVNAGTRCRQPLLLCCMLLLLGCWNCTTNRRWVQVLIQAGSDCTVSMREAHILHRPAPGLRLLCSSVGVVAPGVSATASKSSCVGSGRAPRWLPIDTALSGDRVCSRGVWVTGEAAVHRSRGGVSRCAQGVQVGEGWGCVTGCAAWGLQNWGTLGRGHDPPICNWMVCAAKLYCSAQPTSNMPLSPC